MKSNEHNSLAHTHWHWHRHSRSLQVLCGTPFLIFLLRLHERQSTTTTNSSTTTEQIKSRAPLRTIIISSSFFRDFTFYFFFRWWNYISFLLFSFDANERFVVCEKESVCDARTQYTAKIFTHCFSVSIRIYWQRRRRWWRRRSVFLTLSPRFCCCRVLTDFTTHNVRAHSEESEKTHTHGEKICFALTASSSCFHDSPFYFFFFLCCLFQSCFSDTEASVGFFSCTV